MAGRSRIIAQKGAGGGRIHSAGDPGRYDNRWIVLPPDFRSGTTLQSRGSRSVTAIRQCDVLPLTVPSNVRRLWYAAIALMGLRRNTVGAPSCRNRRSAAGSTAEQHPVLGRSAPGA
jgi:hypothetical protein